jgi:hypothetical protein
MDFVIEKLLELEEEQRRFWQVEMNNDAREEVEMVKIRELGKKMEEHLEADDMWGLAAFVPLVLGVLRNPVLCVFLLALAGRTPYRGLSISLVMLAFISSPSSCLIYLFGGKLVSKDPADLGSDLLNRLRNSEPAEIDGNANLAGDERDVLEADLPSGMGCCYVIRRVLFRWEREQHIDDVEAGLPGTTD